MQLFLTDPPNSYSTTKTLLSSPLVMHSPSPISKWTDADWCLKYIPSCQCLHALFYLTIERFSKMYPYKYYLLDLEKLLIGQSFVHQPT